MTEINGINAANSTMDDGLFVCLSWLKADLAEQPPQDPLLQLVSLQKASGCWSLASQLAAVLGKTIDELQKAKPKAKRDKTVLLKIMIISNSTLKYSHQKR